MNTDKHGLFKFKSELVRVLSRAVFLFCAMCAAAASFFAQENANPREMDFPPLKIALERTIQTGSTEEKREALRFIRNLKTAEASLIALRALRDKSEIVRATAASSVVFLPPDEAVRAILPLLNDKNEFVRKEAAYALGKTRSPAAIAPLVNTLQKDKRLEVKSAAIVALGEIGDSSAIESLTGVLQTARKPEEEFLRRSAARSIGQIAQIIQTGVFKVVTPESFVLDANRNKPVPKFPRLLENFSVFRSANRVLIETLQNTRETDDVRREAAFALGAIGDESALSALRSMLDSEDYFLARIIREALEKILEIQTILDSAP